MSPRGVVLREVESRMQFLGLKYTTSGSSLGACSSSTNFIRYGFALVFVVVDNIDCWLVDASTSHRWKPVAAHRVDVPSYVLEELMGSIDVNIVTKRSSLSFGGCRKGYSYCARLKVACNSLKHLSG
jgi:hypothetical protein